MAGWTTLRVAHTPTHRPPAAHKLHRAPPQTMKMNKQHPVRRSGIAGPTTSSKEVINPPDHTHSYNLDRATQHRAPDRSRSRNHRSRSPKCARRPISRNLPRKRVTNTLADSARCSMNYADGRAEGHRRSLDPRIAPKPRGKPKRFPAGQQDSTRVARASFQPCAHAVG
jgi:hypothetical protein